MRYQFRCVKQSIAAGTLVVACLTSAAGQGGSPVAGKDIATSAGDDGKLERTLIALEKQSWAAWQQRDGRFFEGFLPEDHVEVGFGGVARKGAIVASVSSPSCVVESYALDGFKVTRFAPTTALLTYHAEQKTRCAGNPVPSPVWASSLYIKRGDRWLNALYQQSQAPHK